MGRLCFFLGRGGCVWRLLEGLLGVGGGGGGVVLGIVHLCFRMTRERREVEEMGEILLEEGSLLLVSYTCASWLQGIQREMNEME